MWVWQGLGFDSVQELPSGALAALGCRCRPISTPRSLAASETSAPLPTLRDEDGNLLEIGITGAGTLLSSFTLGSRGFAVEAEPPSRAAPLGGSSKRLAELGRLRFALPGSVVLAPALDTPMTTVLDNAAGGAHFGSVQTAIEILVSRGGGSFCVRVPKCLARLTDEATNDAMIASHMEEYYIVATGVVLGAELQVNVVVHAEGVSTSALNAAAQDPGSVVVHDSDMRFLLRISQRGGPALDPSKIHGGTEVDMGQAIEKWSEKAVSSRPDTWQLLYAYTRSVDVCDESSSFCGSARQPGGFCGESRDDVALAAIACADLTCDPFELSYGDAHVHTMRCMLQAEIADILGVPPEQVLCGPVAPRRPGHKRRHAKTDMVTLNFALLHSEMVELVRTRPVHGDTTDVRVVPQSLPMIRPASPASPTSPPQTTKSLRPSPSQRLASVADLETPARRHMKALSSKPGTRRNSIQTSKSSPTFASAANKERMAAASDAEGSGASVLGVQSLAPSAYEADPPLTIMELGPAVPAVHANEALPENLLAQLLIKVSDKRHPMRRNRDIFPMLARCFENGFRSGELLIASTDVVTPGAVARKLRAFLHGQRPTRRDTLEIDQGALATASDRRRELIRLASEGADLEMIAKVETMKLLSPKKLLDMVEVAFTQVKFLICCLDELTARAARSEDDCVKIRSCSALEQIQEVCSHFKSELKVISKCLRFIQHLTKLDIGSVDRIWEAHMAPTLLTALANFEADHGVQLDGILTLRRLFERSREVDLTGARVVPLGKGLDKVWTFRAVDRIFEIARRFPDDATVQMEACSVLVTLAEFIQNNGLSEATFKVVDTAMRKHGEQPSLLTTGTLIISRLGPSFLAHESRAFRRIVDSMARHRSNVEVQRVGTLALFSLSKQDSALENCRECGGVTATLTAMCAHSGDMQVTQMGVRTLEKLCPRGMIKVMQLCGSVTAVLPPTVWKIDPLDNSDRCIGGDLQAMAKAYSGQVDMERPSMVESFISDLGFWADMTEQDSRIFPESSECEQLATIEGYRSLGVRDEIDTLDVAWAVAGPRNVVVSMRAMSGSSSTKTRLQADIEMLEKANCDISNLVVAGPTNTHLQKLTEAMIEGLDKDQWSAHDGELFGVLLGHFAWHSSERGRLLVQYGAAGGLLNWITAKRFKEHPDPQRVAQSYAMQRACIAALAVLCRQDQTIMNTILSLEGFWFCEDHWELQPSAVLLLHFSQHMDLGIRRCALRCLSRLIPSSSSRENPIERVPVQQAWPIIMAAVRSEEDAALQGAAASCMLEAVCDGWFSDESDAGLDAEAFAAALYHLLVRCKERPVTASCGAVVLPVLLAVGRILAESGALARSLQDRPNLIELLVHWLPMGATRGSTALGRGVATSAAAALTTMLELTFGSVLNASELQVLLIHGSNELAHQPLRNACNSGLAHAVSREDSVELLSKLFNTRLPNAGGTGERLADPEVLLCLAERIVSLLRSSPDRGSAASAGFIEHAEKLLPTAAAQYVEIKTMTSDIRYMCARAQTWSGENSPARSMAAGSVSAATCGVPPRRGGGSICGHSGTLPPIKPTSR